MARINPENERAADWLRVWGGYEVPLTDDGPHFARDPEGELRLFFMADLSRLTDEQVERFVRFAATRFQLDLAEVRADLRKYGIPVLADEIMVVTVDDA